MGGAVEIRLKQLREVVRLWWVKLSLFIVAVLAIGALSGYRVNVSRSLPLGLYRVIGDSTAVKRGSIVIVCLPEAWSRFALQRGILGPGRCPGGSYGLGKLVVAVEGDIVTLSPDRGIVNGESLANGQTLNRDRLGRVLPHYLWGTYTLRAGEIWLYACHPAAFDSRYFGPASVASIKSVIASTITVPQENNCQG